VANLFQRFGATKASAVSIYLPICTEAILSILACARIGTIHSLVFGAFQNDSLQFRINDCHSTVIVTASSDYRATKTVSLKLRLSVILRNWPSVQTVIVCRLTPDDTPMQNGGDFTFEDFFGSVASENEFAIVNAGDPLFYLYASGSTDSSKGIIHRTGGYAVAAALSHRFVFSIRPGDIFGCTSDLGWITSHIYICYDPLLNGITTVVFAELRLSRDATRPWQLIRSLKQAHFYTSMSAARAIAASKAIDNVGDIDISSLRVIVSVGETLDDTTFRFLFEALGRSRCSIVDTDWQTEMESIIATSVPGHHLMLPGCVRQPLFGTELFLLDPGTRAVWRPRKVPRPS
jgi:acetyl-CoA synthetase